MGIAHYENFPVASLLCPAPLRAAVVALYHFARTADDLADEGDVPAAERRRDLADYRADLRAVFQGLEPSARWARIFQSLSAARAGHALPRQPLEDLLSAFEQDTANPIYATRAELLGYCQLSANPVGRLLLHLYGVDDALSLAQADDICSALQLINFWQDLGVDLARGRHYVPQQDLIRFGLSRGELRPGHDTPRTRALVAELCSWAEQLMRRGAPLALRLPGRAGWELRLVVQGGLRVLRRIARLQHRTLSERPTLGTADAAALLWGALRMGRSIAHHATGVQS